LFAQEVVKNTNFFEEIEYELVNGKLIIPVEIQDKVFHFFFDTGGLLVISPEVKEALELRSIDSGTVTGVNKIKTKIDVVVINQLKIGSLEFNNRKAIISNIFQKHPVTCFEVAGIIGRDFLKNMAIQIDQKNNNITLTDQPHRLNLDKVKAQKLHFNENKVPILPIKVNGKNIKKVLFDSGSDDFISFKTSNIFKYRKRKVYSKEDIVELYGNFSLGIGGTYPSPEKQYHIYVEEFQLADITFEEFYSDISKNSNNRIGSALLDYGILTLDFINKKFYFDKYDKTVQIQKINSFGFKMRITEQNAFVSGVFQDSPAASKGIEVGQKILSIENVLLSQLSNRQRCDFYNNNFPWYDNDQIEVKFIDKFGKIKVISLEKFEL